MKRPVSTLVFGILNLVFAAWGLLALAMMAAMMFSSAPGAAGNPVIKLMQDSPGYMLFMKASAILGLAAIIVLALAGVGLLLLKNWGRQLSIVYAVYGIFATIVGFAVNYSFVTAPLLEKASTMPSGPEKAALLGGAYGGLIGGCAGLIYPIILLIFMFRPNVVAALKGKKNAEW